MGIDHASSRLSARPLRTFRCGPCHQFAPIFERSSEDNPEIVHAKLDTEAQPRIPAAAGITAIPTLMAFREGVLVFNQAGALPAAALARVVDAVKDLDMDEARKDIAAQRPATGASRARDGTWRRVQLAVSEGWIRSSSRAPAWPDPSRRGRRHDTCLEEHVESAVRIGRCGDGLAQQHELAVGVGRAR